MSKSGQKEWRRPLCGTAPPHPGYSGLRRPQLRWVSEGMPCLGSARSSRFASWCSGRWFQGLLRAWTTRTLSVQAVVSLPEHLFKNMQTSNVFVSIQLCLSRQFLTLKGLAFACRPPHWADPSCLPAQHPAHPEPLKQWALAASFTNW